MHFSIVDLPEPEAPIRHTTSCSATARSTSTRTGVPSNALETDRDLELGPATSDRVAHPARFLRRSRSVYQSANRATGIDTARNSTAATT